MGMKHEGHEVNMIKILYVYVSKCHRETHCYIQLISTYKNRGNDYEKEWGQGTGWEGVTVV